MNTAVAVKENKPLIEKPEKSNQQKCFNDSFVEYKQKNSAHTNQTRVVLLPTPNQLIKRRA